MAGRYDSNPFAEQEVNPFAVSSIKHTEIHIIDLLFRADLININLRNGKSFVGVWTLFILFLLNAFDFGSLWLILMFRFLYFRICYFILFFENCFLCYVLKSSHLSIALKTVLQKKND